MLYFVNDYSEGAHEKILQHLIDTNMEQLAGYGMDRYCDSAKEKIKRACGCEDAEVFLLTGGTQTNQIVIDTILEPYEGVVAAQTGHVSTHEAGAIEFTGHKVLELPQTNGKICAEDLRELAERFYGDENHEHMVFPGMVYISHPTEYGTLYTKKELTEISVVCREYKLPLFMDGARLIYGLVSKETDVTLQDIAKLCDVFYIGGTKAGALCGEAVVFTGDSMPKHFLTRVKQHGALLAKGRLVGVQFDALFTDDLYLEAGRNAIETAAVLKKGLKEKGYQVLATGEMGIGNTTTSSAVAAVFLGRPVEDMTGRGAGLSREGLVRKINAIKKAIALNNPDRSDAIDVLAKVGGYDIAGMAGVYIGGAALGMPVVMDGFISCVAALVAVKICPQVRDYLIASHVSKEPAAHMLLKELGKEAIIHAGMCLGEGTGAVALFPLIDLSCAVYNSMSTFGDINVEQYEELK